MGYGKKQLSLLGHAGEVSSTGKAGFQLRQEVRECLGEIEHLGDKTGTQMGLPCRWDRCCRSWQRVAEGVKTLGNEKAEGPVSLTYDSQGTNLSRRQQNKKE